MEQSEIAVDAHDRAAMSLVGMKFANYYVKGRAKPGKRPLYIVVNVRTGQTSGMRGNKLVRLAREARVVGLPVAMPRSPWRDE